MEQKIIPMLMKMRAQDALSIQPQPLPEGYRYTSYQPGDETHWADLMASLKMLDSFESAMSHFRSHFMAFPDELAKRCWFIVDPDGAYVATSTAWFKGEGDDRLALLHWVGVKREAHGKGLGKAIVAKALSLFPVLEPGRIIALDTQSFRTKAVGLYLDMGLRLVRDKHSAAALNSLRGVIEDRYYQVIANQPWPDEQQPGTPVHERFLRYVGIETPSSDTSAHCPSTDCQFDLARLLVQELHDMGIADAFVDEHCYVYASIPANVENRPSIGLIAHMDTVDCVPVGPMRSRIVPHYAGGDIELSEGNILREAESLEGCLGDDLIVTDGNTLLGADDKAGIAEIMAVAERLMQNPSIPHGKVCIAFTPDEEVGQGADHFDVEGFGADFAYTVDGGFLPDIAYENFNAASLVVHIRGTSIHPGSAKNRMINAILVAMQYHSLFPAAETPEHTEGREGFYHLDDIKGNVEHATLAYIIRDHDRAKFEARKAFARRSADYLNAQYGQGTLEIELKDSYYNMLEVIDQKPEVVELVRKALRAMGMEMRAVPIRGGTDGARLSYMGLPCPNLPTGGMNGHGRHECASIQEMNRCTQLLMRIVRAD